jgi:hypothetical protein
MTTTALGGLCTSPIPDFSSLMTGGLIVAQNILQDAANEAAIFIGRVFTEDGGSHTVNTTGSSSLGWLAGAVTFAAAAGGSTFKVGLGTVDTATGPPGRATNAANVITFSVNGLYTSGTNAPTASAWNETVPTAGSLAIANGDLVAFSTQMVTRTNPDAVNTQDFGLANNTFPFATAFTGGSYSDNTARPNCVITFSDGARGYIQGSNIAAARISTIWNNGSATKEYGNYMQFPVPVSIVGIGAFLAITGDVSFNLYSDPLGTPTIQKTVAFDVNVVANGNTRYAEALFASPYSLAANTPIGIVMQPTTVTNVLHNGRTYAISGHQTSHELGANCYAINRGTVAGGTPFAAQNSNKDLIHISALLGGFDNGVQSAAGPIIGGRVTQ